jgi:hypothetical protein
MSDITVFNQDLPDFLQDAPVSDLTKSIVGTRHWRRQAYRAQERHRSARWLVGEEMGKKQGPIGCNYC